jgi:hypothetical protein
MTMRIHRSESRLIIRGTGWSGVLAALAALSCVLSIPYFLASSIDTKEAEARVRHYLAWQLSQRYFGNLGVGSRRLPNVETMQRWKEEQGQLKRLEFESATVGRLLPDFFSVRPVFIAKVVVRQGPQQTETRYFWLGRTGDSETSWLAWVFAL